MHTILRAWLVFGLVSNLLFQNHISTAIETLFMLKAYYDQEGKPLSSWEF